MILALWGHARTGKDAIGDIVARYHGYTKLAIADSIRQVVYDTDPVARRHVDLHGWDSYKAIGEGRDKLNAMGEAMRKQLGSAVWMECLWTRIAQHSSAGVIITDVRLPEEARLVRKWGGKLVRVTKPGCGPKFSWDATTAGDVPFSGAIHNDGTLQELPGKVEYMLQEMGVLAW